MVGLRLARSAPTPDVPSFDRGIAPEDVLDGRYFDDVLMALTLSNEGAA